VHFYGELAGVQWMVDTVAGLYPNMTIWLTEWANPDQDLEETQITFNQTLAWLDEQPFLERYSYFGAFRSYASNVGYNASLLDSCGNLTDLGDWYLDRPAQGYIPGPLPCPYGPQDVRCDISNGLNYTDPATGDVFTIECYLDHYGGDIPGDGLQTNFTECIALCANSTIPCDDVSWANGPCYLKSGALASPTTDYNVWGARLLATTGVRTSTSLSSAPTSSATAASTSVASTTTSGPSGSSTTSSSVSSSSSVTELPCATGLHIPTPTAFPGMACASVAANSYASATIPFELNFFGNTSSLIFAEDSGVRIPPSPFQPKLIVYKLLSLNSGSTAFVNNNLPDPQFNGATEPLQALMPFFIDMGISNNGRDGVWYSATSSVLYVEWRTSARGNSSDLYDFSVEYQTSAPGTFIFRYYVVGEYGAFATVGAQAGPEGEFCQTLRKGLG
jgi:hypothetical protein